MATPAQRAISALDAQLNTVSTVTQRQRVVAAFGSAENYIRALLDYTKNQVKVYENIAAKEATQAAVDNGFAEVS